MKRILSVILTLVLLCCCGVCNADYYEDETLDEGGQFILEGYTTGVLLEDASALNPRTGPGLLYDPVDPKSIAAFRGDEIRILSRVYSGGILWVLAEVSSFYSSNIRCYLIAQSDSQKIQFDTHNVPIEAGPDDLLSEWQCSCYEYQAYHFGPGNDYAYTGTSLSPSDNAWVILMDGDWALVESSNRYDDLTTGIFARRGWVLFDLLIY